MSIFRSGQLRKCWSWSGRIEILEEFGDFGWFDAGGVCLPHTGHDQTRPDRRGELYPSTIIIPVILNATYHIASPHRA